MELLVTASILSLLALLIVSLSRSGAESSHLSARQNRVAEVGQEQIARLRLDLTSSVRIFTSDALGSGYLARLDRDGLPGLDGERMPALDPSGTFQRDDPGLGRTGNVVFLARHDRTDLWRDPTDPDATHRTDVYRFVAYYLRKAVPGSLAGRASGLDLVRWVSVPFADASQVDRVGDPARREALLLQLREGDNPDDPSRPFPPCRYLWRLGAQLDAPGCFQEILADGVLDDRTFDVPAFRILADPSRTQADRLWYRGFSVATNDARDGLGVARFALKDTTGDGFPHGFEAQVIGPAAARQVLVRLSLIDSAENRARAFTEASSVVDCRDL